MNFHGYGWKVEWPEKKRQRNDKEGLVSAGEKIVLDNFSFVGLVKGAGSENNWILKIQEDQGKKNLITTVASNKQKRKPPEGDAG